MRSQRFLRNEGVNLGAHSSSAVLRVFTMDKGMRPKKTWSSAKKITVSKKMKKESSEFGRYDPPEGPMRVAWRVTFKV